MRRLKSRSHSRSPTKDAPKFVNSGRFVLKADELADKLKDLPPETSIEDSRSGKDNDMNMDKDKDMDMDKDKDTNKDKDEDKDNDINLDKAKDNDKDMNMGKDKDGHPEKSSLSAESLNSMDST